MTGIRHRGESRGRKQEGSSPFLYALEVTVLETDINQIISTSKCNIPAVA